MKSKPAWYRELEIIPFHDQGFKEHFRHQVLTKTEQEKIIRENKIFLYPAISFSALALCMLVFFQMNSTGTATLQTPTGIDSGFRYISANLEEEMWHVDAIISGKVLDSEDSESLDVNMKTKKNYAADVTPALIQVSQVLYGEVTASTITLLQHGNASNKDLPMVHSGEELILILVKTTSGEFWAYDQNNGIWTINDDKVEAPNAIAPMDKLNGLDVNTFEEQIITAAKHKKKPAGMK
ncbi:hypothetical protein ACX12E_18690 [Paenibacillus vandeheii]